uniref:Uncharacterized protein n=1 Tax=Anguilla anguilla TaxID=7936 RepID=A0A0E9WHV1_ANGAN
MHTWIARLSSANYHSVHFNQSALCHGQSSSTETDGVLEFKTFIVSVHGSEGENAAMQRFIYIYTRMKV